VPATYCWARVSNSHYQFHFHSGWLAFSFPRLVPQVTGMKRANTFAVRPLSDDGEQVLRDLLDASAALWNEINYQRLMRYNGEDGFEGDV